MSEIVQGVVHATIQCFCSPPKTLHTNEEHQVARCENCGVEIISGAHFAGARHLKLVDGEA